MSEKRQQKQANKKNIISMICKLFALAWLVCIILFINNKQLIKEEKEQIGLTAVKALYDFRDAYQLDSNMVTLKEITTEPVFNDLTIDNEQRTLNTYLKFEGKSVTVNILKNTDSYVLYSLNTEKISDERIFVFFFDVDKEGKISWYKEVEGIEFVNTIY